MKKLIECSNNHEAEMLVLELESHGIAAQISSKNTSNLGIGAFGFIQPNVHIIFDHQYEDALALMNDSEYEVTTGFSTEDLELIKENSDKLSPNIAYSIIATLALACVALVVLTYLFLK